MNKVLKILGLDFGTPLENKFLDWSYLFVRVGVSVTMALSHGYGKVLNFSKIAPNFPDPHWTWS